jgi:hypothetical protein
MGTCAMRLAVAAAALCLLGGCAYSYVGQDGSRHLVGLVHVSLPHEGAQPPASSVRARTLGISFTQGGAGNALSLGYSDTTLAQVQADTCVRWPIASSPASHQRTPP